MAQSQPNTSKAMTPQTVAYFLCPFLRKDPELIKILEKMITFAVKVNLNAKLLTESELYSVSFSPEAILVFKKYESTQYKNWVIFTESSNASEVGAHPIVYSSYDFNRKVKLGPIAPHRTQTVKVWKPMSSFYVLVSGFDDATKQNLEQQVVEMGGEVKDDDTPLQTLDYVVVSSALTKKALEASSFAVRIPVVKQTWIQAAYRDYKNNKAEPTVANDEKYVDHLIKTFYNTVICFPRHPNEEASAYEKRFYLWKKRIEPNEGTVTLTLQERKPHVVIVEALAGEIYGEALKLDSFCVTDDWLFESDKSGALRCPERFPIREQDSPTDSTADS